MNDERIVEQHNGYTTEWACDPPPFGSTFRVVRDEWSDDYTHRTVYEWERLLTDVQLVSWGINPAGETLMGDHGPRLLMPDGAYPIGITAHQLGEANLTIARLRAELTELKAPMESVEVSLGGGLSVTLTPDELCEAVQVWRRAQDGETRRCDGCAHWGEYDAGMSVCWSDAFDFSPNHPPGTAADFHCKAWEPKFIGPIITQGAT